MTKEALDLINQDHLDDNRLETSGKNMDNSKPSYGLLAISDADVEFSSDDSSIGAHIEHSD